MRGTLGNVFLRIAGAVIATAVLSGCTFVRYGDYLAPSFRLDGPTNLALPDEGDHRVADAISRWDGMAPVERQRYPTPYHMYVDTPAPGSFEGDHTIAVAFSGGFCLSTAHSSDSRGRLCRGFKILFVVFCLRRRHKSKDYRCWVRNCEM